ncbi:MAG: PepSY-like domain-containing protein [Ginsengibacter sp.]
MKKIIAFGSLLMVLSFATSAQTTQKNKEKEEKEQKSGVSVPSAVKAALMHKYPSASKVTWEKEHGNFEANWGGKDGEANSVLFTPAGEFMEAVEAIPIDQLPKASLQYVKTHYKSAKIKEAGKVTDKNGKTTYEAEVNGKDVIFDMQGNFVKVEK